MAEEPTHEDHEDDDVYDHKTREHLVDDDELSAEEEAFMEGYDEEDPEEDETISRGDQAYEEAFEE